MGGGGGHVSRASFFWCGVGVDQVSNFFSLTFAFLTLQQGSSLNMDVLSILLYFKLYPIVTDRRQAPSCPVCVRGRL